MAFKNNRKQRSQNASESLQQVSNPSAIADSSSEREKRQRLKNKKANRIKQKGKKKTLNQKILIAAAVIVGCALIVALGIFTYDYIDVILHRPGSAFETTPKPIEHVDSMDNENATLTPTMNPSSKPIDILDLQAQLDAQADKTIITDDILNVMIIGVDYADERVSDDWTGKTAFHADVMMVLAINFKENTVNMISLPRDTYARIPYIEGIYKLNASLDCGGGMVPEGYQKVCEAAEWMLGGIPVDYYYAVTMPVVKRLGDLVGGVDYNIEFDFSMAGRHYTKGMQHLDGQGILDYLRVRKNIEESGDLNRVNRQKRMLVALFSQMKQSNKLLLIPEILSAFGDDIATNTTLQQTMALALWALDLDSENISMHSMGGIMESIFGWNFCLTDQQNRVNIIKKVYGVEVKPYLYYTKEYARFRWQTMLYDQAFKTTDGMVEKIEDFFGEYCPTPPPNPTLGSPSTSAPNQSETPIPTPVLTPTPEPSEAPLPTPNFTDEQYAALYWVRIRTWELQDAYDEAVKQAELFIDKKPNTLAESVEQLTASRYDFQAAFEHANKVFKLKYKLEWSVQYWLDPEFNEIKVDFR